MVQPVHHTEADGRGQPLWPPLTPGSSKSGHLPRERGPGSGWVVEGMGQWRGPHVCSTTRHPTWGLSSAVQWDRRGHLMQLIQPGSTCPVLPGPGLSYLSIALQELAPGWPRGVCVCVCVCVCSFYKALSTVRGLKWVVSRESSLYVDWNPAFQIACILGSQ